MMPQRFGRYWLHEKIGQGGMADVYRASMGPDADSAGFELAIKRLRAELAGDAAAVAQFHTEAEVGQLLRHPNLLDVYEAGNQDGHLYLAMERVWGQNLAQLVEGLRRRRLLVPADLALYVALQVLRALDYVHRAKDAAGRPLGIVHGDVTPSNVHVGYDGAVKLGDFGIVHLQGRPQPDAGRTLAGKLPYLPPEMLAGAPVSLQLDLYSLALALYEMLTARSPYEGVAPATLLRGGRRPPIVPPHRLNPRLPAALWPPLQRALDPRPQRRPADAASLYRELKGCLVALGTSPDAAALAHFMRKGTQRARAEPQRQAGPSDAVFARPGYQAPLEPSPTQRHALHPQPRGPGLPRWLGWSLALGFGLSLGVALGYHLGVGGASAADSDRAALQADALDALVASQVAAALQRGAAHLSQSEGELAAKSFRLALALRPQDPAATLGLGDALLLLGQLPQAGAQALQVLGQLPDDPRALHLLGRTLHARGLSDEADTMLQRCIRADPDGPLGHSAASLRQAWAD